MRETRELLPDGHCDRLKTSPYHWRWVDARDESWRGGLYSTLRCLLTRCVMQEAREGM